MAYLWCRKHHCLYPCQFLSLEKCGCHSAVKVIHKCRGFIYIFSRSLHVIPNKKAIWVPGLGKYVSCFVMHSNIISFRRSSKVITLLKSCPSEKSKLHWDNGHKNIFKYCFIVTIITLEFQWFQVYEDLLF